MKKREKEDLRSKSLNELVAEAEKKQAEIFRLSLEMKTGEVKNTSQLRKKSDDLAVIKTILQEKKFSQT